MPQNGFSSSADCSLSGLPSGININPYIFEVSSGKPGQVQFSMNSLAVSGNAGVTVSCTSGSIAAETLFTLVVQVQPAIVLSATPASLTFHQGDQESVNINITGLGGIFGNVTGTVTGLPDGITVLEPSFSNGVNSFETLNFTAASTAVTSGSATVSVTNGTYSATINVPLIVNSTPDFAISTGYSTGLTMYQSSTANFILSSTSYNGFSQPISVTFSGLPTGITFSPASFSLQPGASQAAVIAADFTQPPGTIATITITATGGGITHTAQFTITILQPELILTAEPNPVDIPAGSLGLVQFKFLGTPQATGSVIVTVGTPPPGVTASPRSYTIPATGGSGFFYLQTTATASSGYLRFVASYDPYVTSTVTQVTVETGLTPTPVPLGASDQLVHMDALTPYAAFPPPNYVIYHAATNHFLSTDAYLNQLNVIDAASRKRIATLDIPGAFGIDQAPDGSVVYVGTTMGDLYVVDPVKLAILKRYPSSTIGSYGFQADAVYALADGKLLLEQYFFLPGYSGSDGHGPLALWDPTTNNITVFSNSPVGQLPTKPTCLGTFQQAILVSNRTRVLLSPVATSQTSSPLCSFDPEADTWNLSGDLGNIALGIFAVSSDGSVLAAYNGQTLYNLDPATLAVKNSFAIPPVETFPAGYASMFLSQDNSKVFLSDSDVEGIYGSDMAYVYDLTTGVQTGWMPQVNQILPSEIAVVGPLYQAMSSAGLEAGVLQDDGVGLLDTTAVLPMPIGSHLSLTQLNIPYGPPAGATFTYWLPGFTSVPPPPLGSIYFGANPATDLNNDDIFNTLSAVTPPGAPGPVDVRVFATNGGSQYLPEGYSYGPWVLEAPTSYATAEGGGPASLFGYGFGPQADTGSTSPPPIPSDLQITVGGASATVTSYNADPYSVSNRYPPSAPFPSSALVYTVPPGSAGTSSNIQVSNTTGTSQAGPAISYLPATRQFPVSDTLADGVYDPTRNLYYFTGVNQVYVFSPADGAWRTPIPIPVPQGAYGPQRLFGIAISSDGSKLAIGDPGALAIYIVDPDNPGSVQSFPLTVLGLGAAVEDEPAGLAVTNGGDVYFASFNFNYGGFGGGIILLHSSTGTFVSIPSAGYTGDDPYVRLALSSDGTRLYTNIKGVAGYYDIVAGQFVYAPKSNEEIGRNDDEMVLCANQTSLSFEGLIADWNLNNLGWQTLDTAEKVDAKYVYGAAFSSDGSLFFQPGNQFIDVFNGYTGSFRARVSLPFQLSANFRALVSNFRDSTLVAITGTGNGIAVIDLNSLPEPPPVAYSLMAPLSRTSRSVSGRFSAKAPQSGGALSGSGGSRTPSIPYRKSALLNSLLHLRPGSPGATVGVPPSPR